MGGFQFTNNGDAEAFLVDRIIERVGVAGFSYQCARDKKSFAFSAVLDRAGSKKRADQKAEHRFELRLGADRDFPDDFTVSKLVITGAMRGRGLGAASVATIAGLAHAARQPSIIIRWAIDDGPSFWPAFGALPLVKPDYLAVAIGEHIRTAALPLPDARLLQDMAETLPYAALRQWSQLETMNHTDRVQKANVLIATCNYSDLVILPGEAGTRAILAGRLARFGAMPPFDLPKDAYLKKICRQLEQGLTPPYLPVTDIRPGLSALTQS